MQENHFDTLKILHNQAIPYGDVALCGSRGWFFEDTPEAQDEKVLAREVGRIRMSLEAAGDREKIVFLHYPPVTTGECLRPDRRTVAAVRRAKSATTAICTAQPLGLLLRGSIKALIFA